jgi:membrane-bound lytic murein transglycosylase MltF
MATGVREVVVTGRSTPQLTSIDDLAGRSVHLRRSSSDWESLERLNEDFRNRGLDPVEFVPVEEFLEDEDLLEMVNAGLLPLAIVDSHKARFWAQVFEDLVVRDDLTVRDGGAIGWAFRKDSPQVANMVNGFAKGHKKGTLFGNVEVVARREIGRETVRYVSNIAKYYVAYRLATAIEEQKETDAEARAG